MMTPKQTQLYWREWAACKRALESAIGYRLSAIEIDQRRHSLALEACGKESTKAFTNSDLDKVLAIFRAQIRPADLNAQLAQQSQPRKRLLWFINSCNPNYVAALLQERFAHASDSNDLNDADLRALHMTLKNRPRAVGTRSTASLEYSPSELVTAEPF